MSRGALGTDGASANDNMVLQEAMRAVATSQTCSGTSPALEPAPSKARISATAASSGVISPLRIAAKS